ncbi:unnamed protein product [Lactuca saligna]|uniref:Uncharacterized protein n=1 Tax=Lactuca saligna TaxID=75948 RepID=A0AA36DZM8_LACSI|nr:unnamed protein product [Lactuca saligna]
MVFKQGVTAHGDWVSIEDLFRDNKDTCVLHLDQEICSIEIDDILGIEYYKKRKLFFDLLAIIEQPIPRKKTWSPIWRMNFERNSTKFQVLFSIKTHYHPYFKHVQRFFLKKSDSLEYDLSK